MGNKMLILCENSKVFGYLVFDIGNQVLNMDFNIKIIPSIKKLMSDESKEVTVISMDSDTLEKLQRAKVPHKSFEQYTPMVKSDELNERAMLLIRGNDAVKNKEFLKESLYYDDIPLWDLVELYLHDKLKKLIFDIELIKHIVGQERPDIIMITDHESMCGRAAIAVANLKGIPFLKLRHTPLLPLKYIVGRKLKIHVSRIYERMIDYRRFKSAGRKSLDYKHQKSGLVNKEYKVLMLSDELRHAPQVIPWAKELIKKDKVELMIISIYPWPKKYRGLGISFKTFSQYDKGISKKAYQKARTLVRNWERLEGDSTLRRSMIYDNISIFDVSKYTISHIFKSHFDKIIKYIEITKYIIDKEKPDVIVVMDDRSWPGKTVVRTCSQKGIPTLVNQHGLHSDAPHYGPTYADKMSVYGELTKKVLIKRGVKPEKIVITGGPQWDELIKSKGLSKKEFCRQLGLNENRGIILLATDIIFDLDIGKKVLIGVLKAVRNFPQMQLLIRAHPAEPISLYRSIAKEVGAGDAVVFKKPHDYDSIMACDLLITQYSTVAMDAIIAGKPVITINLSNGGDPYPYAESGAALGVHRAEDIAPSINEVLNNPSVQQRLSENRERFLYEHVYKVDGKASERVADLIEKIIQERKVAECSREK